MELIRVTSISLRIVSITGWLIVGKASIESWSSLVSSIVDSDALTSACVMNTGDSFCFVLTGLVVLIESPGLGLFLWMGLCWGPLWCSHAISFSSTSWCSKDGDRLLLSWLSEWSGGKKSISWPCLLALTFCRTCSRWLPKADKAKNTFHLDSCAL